MADEQKPQKVEIVGLDIPFYQLTLLCIKLVPAFLLAMAFLAIATVCVVTSIGVAMEGVVVE